MIDEDNVMNLKKNGFVVWLKAGIDILKEEDKVMGYSGITRPSLTGRDTMDEVEAVLASRNPLYKKAGDLVIETDKISHQRGGQFNYKGSVESSIWMILDAGFWMIDWIEFFYSERHR